MEVLSEAGVEVLDERSLEALHIYDYATGDLVTVIEVVSPGNKTSDHEIFAYQERRGRLYLERRINVVEIDITRSIKRLSRNTITDRTPYHGAIFIPGDPVRIVEMFTDQPLKRLALPLRGEVIPIEVHEVYAQAYQNTNIAWHIRHENGYSADSLPFPSLLTAEQKADALAAVKTWHDQLARARTDSENR